MGMNSLQFLKSLYGQDALEQYGYFALTTYNKDRSVGGGPTYRFKSFIEAIGMAQVKRAEHEVYYNLGLQRQNLGTNKRGSWDNITLHPGLYSDMDIANKSAHKKDNLPRSIEEALDIFKFAFGKEPSIVVDSGYGVHVYALPPKPVVIASPEDALNHQKALIRMHEHLKAAMLKKGYTLDSVFDLPRILRLPETYNHKDLNSPKMCTIIAHTTKRYTIEEWLEPCAPFTGSYTKVVEIENVINGTSEKPKKTRAKKETQATLDISTPNVENSTPNVEAAQDAEPKPAMPTIKVDLEVQRPDLLIQTLCDNSKAFKRDFYRADKENREDKSPSSYDMGIANACANAGLEDQQIADILICFRREQYAPTDPNWATKILRKDYIPRTIAAAKKKFAKQQAINSIAAAPLEKANGDPEIIARNLRVVSDALGFKVAAVVKYQGDSCQYDMQTEHGTIRFPSTERLITFRLFKVTVADRTGVVIPNMKADKWEPIAQAILNSAVVEFLQGIDTCSIVADYTRMCFRKAEGGLDSWKTANQSKKPFIDKHGDFYIFCETIYDQMRFDGRIMGMPEIAAALVRLGCRNRKRNFLGEDEKKRVQAWCWLVPLEVIHGKTIEVSSLEADNEDMGEA